MENNNYVSSIISVRDAPIPTYFSNQRDDKRFKASNHQVKVSIMDDLDPDHWGRISQFDEGKIRFKINTLLQTNKGVRRLK